MPIRTRHTPQQTFRQLLQHVKASSLEAYDHQELPFEQIIEAISLPRDTSRNPLVQVMVQLIELPGASLTNLDGLDVESLEAKDGSSRFDLEFFLRRSADGLKGKIVYTPELFSRNPIERLCSHLLTLMASALQAPDASCDSLCLLSAAERQLIESWQYGQTIDVPDLYVHQLFEQRVERTPDAIALIFEDQQLTYADLNARANQLAHHLLALGVGPEVIVAVCLERSVELIVSLLAILKAGGAYLPLDPSWPEERHALLLQEATCRVLIKQDEAIVLEDQSPQEGGTSGSMLAYVSYTSGSTGKPKGVAISHHSILRLVDPVNGFLLSAGHRVLQLAPVAFDAATFEIWGPLLNGGTLVVAPQEQPTLPALAALLKNHGITTLWLTAGLFHAMVGAELPALAAVQQILAGGDVLSGEHMQRLLDAFPPGHQLINGYGPTENTTFTCCQHFEAAATVDPNRVAIGRPIANTEVRVLDEGGQPCPIGIPGELHIGGDGLARGYLNNSELTAEKFIPDPFSSDPTARLYKSGDLASWNPDGTLAFHGRIDQQIKLRGFRIEPGEIEAHLLSHPAVAQAVVLLRHDDPSNPRLIAYWVADASHKTTPEASSEQLRAFLADRLPDYMVPAAFLQLEALPLTPNGKLDRRALPAPSFSGNLEQRVVPSTDLERQLHAIWAEVLGHSDFGITDNFFVIGGHSIAAARLVSRIEQAIGSAPTLAALFQNPSITGLTPLLSDSSAAAEENKSAKEAHQATPSENEACQIARIKQFFADSDIDAIYPLNYIQKGFLIQSRLSRTHDPYLNINIFTFNSAENCKRFIQACKDIAERHPLLRARFAWEELPEPVQIILKTPLEVNETSAVLLSNVDICTKLFELIPKALDLRKTPPFQIYTLNAESTERWAAAMLIHHIAYDMPSRRIIENEIRMIMAGQQQKLPEPACPSSLIQSSDAVAATSRDFFATMLQGAKPTLVPLSLESKPNKHIIAEQAQSSLDHTDMQDLFFCASLIGASSSSVILHAYSKVISRLTKSNDIILGIVIDQRSFSGFSKQSLVGPFITILPLRVPAASNSAADSASFINSTLGNLITHNTLPIKEIKKSAGFSLAAPMFNSIINIIRSESPPDPNMKQLFQEHQVDNRENMQLSRSFPFYFLVNLSEHLQSVNLSVRLPGSSQMAQEIATEFKQELKKTIKAIIQDKSPSEANKMQD